MSINQPTNLNFASTERYKFNILKLPSVNYFLTNVSIPSIDFDKVDVPTPFKKFPVIGDEIIFSNFECTFNVDEDFKNYKEILNWILNISNSESFDRYPKVSFDSDEIYSDASLIIYNSSFNPSLTFSFRNIFPISLNLNEFSIQNQDITTLTATTSFVIESFEVN